MDVFLISVLFDPFDSLFEFCIVVAVLLEVLLKLGVVVLNDLKLLFGQHLGYVVEMILYTLDQLECLLL